ncbi:MAG: Hpt domain-containing protein [Gemmatimonadetes bacterium]|nr:Hpt domain-containing protein [Gemmatimonadota bacterium]
MGDDVLEGAALERLLRIGGQDFLLEMIDLFLQHAPERIRAATAAAARGDDQALYRAAHSLKSTAANLGARALQQIAERVEGRAAAQDTAGIPPLLDEMAARYDEVRQRLEAERRRRSGR